jgi:hypothetical protein
MIKQFMLAGALGLAACAGPMAGEPDAPGGMAWQCDAAGAQSLIGSHRGAVTFPVDANVRFVCSECAMTQDYRPDRLTIIYDEDTGVIEQVRCV